MNDRRQSWTPAKFFSVSYSGHNFLSINLKRTLPVVALLKMKPCAPVKLPFDGDGLQHVVSISCLIWG